MSNKEILSDNPGHGVISHLVGPELLALVMDDVSADIVEEARVVRHDHGGDIGEVGQVLNNPSDVLGVKMVGRLIQL
jgi:hypothetical protein